MTRLVAKITRQVIAVGGTDGEEVMRYVLKATGRDRPSICCIPTPSGDSPYALLDFYRTASRFNCVPSDICLLHSPSFDVEARLLVQDVIWVPGGSTRNCLSIWNAWGLGQMLRSAYGIGVVMAGTSAGANVWFDECIINPHGDVFLPMGGIGLIDGLFCPHFEDELYMDAALSYSFDRKDAYACSSVAALHFIEGSPNQVLFSKNVKAPQCFRLRNGEIKPL